MLVQNYNFYIKKKIKNSKKSITEKVKEVYESILASYVTWKLVRQSEKEEKARLSLWKHQDPNSQKPSSTRQDR